MCQKAHITERSSCHRKRQILLLKLDQSQERHIFKIIQQKLVNVPEKNVNPIALSQ
jgi:hypothetical protein